jgi:hypothetical protein
MQGAKERRLSRITNTSQGGAIEGNTADDTLMVDQGPSRVRIVLCLMMTHRKCSPSLLAMHQQVVAIELQATEPDQQFQPAAECGKSPFF